MKKFIEAENVKEFEALIKRYRSITLEEIEKKGVHPRSLTGFGAFCTCTLCKKVFEETFYTPEGCRRCVYGSDRYCLRSKTYEKIETATTSYELLVAFRKRAFYMMKILRQYKKKLKTSQT